MTLDELIEKAKQADGWRLVGEKLRNRENRCPILAVYHLVRPASYDPKLRNYHFIEAGEALGLFSQIGAILAAADGHGEPWLRDKLLNALIPHA